MSDLALILFGAPRIERDGAPLHVGRHKALALLGYLAVTRLPHRRDKLATLLWPDLNQDHARAALRRTLSTLRATLPRPVLITGDANIALDQQADLYVDVFDFRRLMAEAQHAVDAHRIHILETATQIYRDDFLSGFSMPDSPEFEEWQRTESESLRQDLAATLAELAGWHTAQHSYPTAIRYAQRWVGLDPLNEAAQERLVWLYTETGDLQAAQRQYALYSHLVEEEIGERLPQSAAEYWSAIALKQSDSARHGPQPQVARPAIQPVQGNHPPAVAELRLPPSDTDAPVAQILASDQASRAGAPPLIGRSDEWRLLKRLWNATIVGKAHCVVLAGEAGIGKTRLAEELVGWLRQRGEDVAAAHCYAGEGSLAYSPVVTWLRADAMKRGVAELEPIWINELARLLPELQTIHPEVPPPAPITEGWQRQRFFEALAHTFLCSKRPLLLFLDDLQWCDVDTLAWLRFLLRREPDAPLLLLAAMRIEEVTENHPVTYLLDAFDTSNQLTEIVLGRLDAGATTEVANDVAHRRLSDAEAAYVYNETEGNPLFIVETVHAGLDIPATHEVDPHLEDDRRSWHHPLPVKVQTVIRSRLAHLTPESRAVAGVAATIGREFHFGVLGRATGSKDELIADCIDELLARRVLTDKGNGHFDFSHDKLREVIYTDLSTARRQINHRNVAHALEAFFSSDNLERMSAQIAYHFDMAGQEAEAAACYRRAALAAQRLYANADAVRYYQRSLALLAETEASASDRSTIHEALGDLHHLMGAYGKAETNLRSALALASGVDRARILGKLATLERDQRNYEKAHAVYDEALTALAVLPAAQDDEAGQRAYWQQWISIQHQRHMIYYWLGQMEESAALLNEMEAMLEKWGDLRQRANFYQARGLMNFRRNRHISTPEVIADARASLAAHQAAGASHSISSSQFALGFLMLWSGDPAAADAQLRISLRMAEPARDVSLQARCLTYLAIANRQLNQVNTTRMYVERARTVAEEAQMPEYIGAAHANASWLAWQAGDWERAKDEALTALAIWRQLPATHASLPFQWTALWPLIDVLRRQGDFATAVAHLAILAGPDQQRLPDVLSAPVTAILTAWDDHTFKPEQLEECVRIAQRLRFL